MKRLTLTSFLLLCGSVFGHAQQIDPSYQIAWPSACSAAGMVYSPGSNTCVAVSSSTGNTTSNLTAGRIPLATGANAIGDSSLQDNGTIVSTTEPVSAGSSVSTTPGSVNAYLDLPTVGVLPATPGSGTVRIASPNSVTPYVLALPGAAPSSTSYLSCTGTPAICSWATPFNPASPGALGGTTPSTGNFTTMSAQHVVGTSPQPSYVIDSAGSGGTASLVAGSTDVSGWFNYTPPSGGSGTGAGLITIVFSTPYGSEPPCTIRPSNAAAAALTPAAQPYVSQGSSSANNFVVMANSTALPGSTPLQWWYGCL